MTFIAPHVESLRRQNEHTIFPTFQTKFHSFLTVEALDLTQKQVSYLYIFPTNSQDLD